jgi:hypothetical protein
MIRTGNRTAICMYVDAQYYYRTEIRIAIRFAANRTEIRIGNRIRVDGPLATIEKKFCNICWLHSCQLYVLCIHAFLHGALLSSLLCRAFDTPPDVQNDSLECSCTLSFSPFPSHV